MAKKTIDLQKYVKKLEQFAENIIEKMIRVYSNENAENTFKTLNHGDLWVNNIMFNDDKNDVLLVKFVSFIVNFISYSFFDKLLLD